MGNNELGIYEGCYVELRNGAIEGPVQISTARKVAITVGDDGYRKMIWYYPSGTFAKHGESEFDIVRVIDPIKLSPKNPNARFEPVIAQPTIPPHVLQAAMGAGIKADPAYEQFVSAILEAGIAAMGDVRVERPTPVEVTDELLEQIATVFGDKGFYEWSDVGQLKMRGAAECVISFFGRSADPKNESENRIQDSEKPKGGLSDLTLKQRVIQAIDRSVDKWEASHGNKFVVPSATITQAVMGVLDGAPAASPTIPSAAQIDETIRQCVSEWRKTDNGTAFSPPSRYIAAAVHRMLVDRSGEEPVNLVAPEGWYLAQCNHEHQPHRFAGQIVEPMPYKNGAWSVEFQYLNGGGHLTGARGHNLVEAWQNAVEAVRQYEIDRSLDL